MAKPKNSFLLSPYGSPEDRYGSDGAIDWSDIPPWRQTSFFGIRARGQFFVYVVDCSGSMIDDDRMPRATIELRRSVFALREPQRFEVIFYNTESIPMPGGPVPRSGRPASEVPVALVPPTDRSRRRHRPPSGHEAGTIVATRRRLSALRRSVSRRDGRRAYPAQLSQNSDPLRRPHRWLSRRPSQAHRRWPTTATMPRGWATFRAGPEVWPRASASACSAGTACSVYRSARSTRRLGESPDEQNRASSAKTGWRLPGDRQKTVHELALLADRGEMARIRGA